MQALDLLAADRRLEGEVEIGQGLDGRYASEEHRRLAAQAITESDSVHLLMTGAWSAEILSSFSRRILDWRLLGRLEAHVTGR
jgi:hypothetical protein